VVMDSSLEACQPPPSGQAGVGGGGEACQRTPLWVPRPDIRLTSDSDDVWVCGGDLGPSELTCGG
jgi:hypothetical protein